MTSDLISFAAISAFAMQYQLVAIKALFNLLTSFKL